MMTLSEVLITIEEIQDETVVQEFVHHGWVKPVEQEGNWLFDPVDIARIRLVHQLRHELLVEDETMSLVLSLMDQLYTTRHQLKQMCQAISKQPRSVQAEIFSLMEEKNR